MTSPGNRMGDKRLDELRGIYVPPCEELADVAKRLLRIASLVKLWRSAR